MRILRFDWGCVVWGVIFLMNVCGCATTSSSQRRAQSVVPDEAAAAMATAVMGRPVESEQVEALIKRAGRDPEAREALTTLSTAVIGQRPLPVYCPIDGERYSPSLTVCPRHGVPLRPLQADDENTSQREQRP